jgi:hypothetical protein
MTFRSTCWGVFAAQTAGGFSTGAVLTAIAADAAEEGFDAADAGTFSVVDAVAFAAPKLQPATPLLAGGATLQTTAPSSRPTEKLTTASPMTAPLPMVAERDNK